MYWFLILLFLAFLMFAVLGVPWLAYRRGRKLGNVEGYGRGYHDGRHI